MLTGDVPSAVGDLKKEGEGNLLIMGSGALVQSLIPQNLIDEYRLLIYPLLLGGGVRLFPVGGGALHRLHLVDCTPTTTGVILATYRPASTVP